MLEISIPGRGDFAFQYLFLDVNGTLATDGVLTAGVAERLAALSDQLAITLLTADTHGKLAEINAVLKLNAHKLTRGNEQTQKAEYIASHGPEKCIAIGNGANDQGMLKAAAIGIVVLGQEGLSVEAVQAADVITASILDALDLLLKPKRLVATLRR